jgi:hypothetical protein
MESQLETAAISIPIHSIHGDLTIVREPWPTAVMTTVHLQSCGPSRLTRQRKQ